jgi:signal peptidase I
MLFAKKFSYGIPTPRIPWIEVAVAPDSDGDGHLIQGDRPQRGDIVIFRYPQNDKIHYVKRCVATQGDEVIFYPEKLFIRFSEGDEYMKKHYPNRLKVLNGKLYVENPYMRNHKGIAYGRSGGDSFLDMLKLLPYGEVSMTPIYVDELEAVAPRINFNAFYAKMDKDNFFMVGDNRDQSNDSRFWGSVPYKNVVGQPWFIYFSWDSNREIRWDRMFRTVDSIEEDLKH